MEVCLLVLLSESQGYGYGLIEELAHFGFDPEQLNVSTLYRSLRKMEKEDLVTSSWASGGQGPRRCVYEITEKGKEELALWITVLNERKLRITQLIERYQLSPLNDH